MRFRAPLFCLTFFLSVSVGARAQSETDLLITEIIEDHGKEAAEDYDFAELTERLNYYLRHPMNLNKVSESQLAELFFLDPLQINALIEHRRLNGDYLDLLELQSVPLIDLGTIRKLLPFIQLSAENTIRDFQLRQLQQGKHDLILRFGQILQAQQGYRVTDPSASKYLGTPARYLVRYRFNSDRRLAVAINMEKDAGEQFFAGKQSIGFDYYSASILIKQIGIVEKLVIGDFGLQFGQGLSLWSGLSFSKGASVASIAKQDLGLRQNSSFNEALFFRGISASVKLNNLTFTPFLSYNRIDAGQEAIAGETAISSIGLTGLHRTNTEVAKKSTVPQLVAGGALQFNLKRLNLGLTGYHSQFNLGLKPGEALYDQFELTGSRLSNVGLNYNFTYRNTYFFGEVAHSLGSGLGILNGAITSLSPRISVSILQRRYDRDYHSLFNQAISENTSATNERGVYSGLTFKFGRAWEVSSYFDMFRFPWLKFRVDAPSNGYEFLSQVVYAPNKKLKISGRYRSEAKQENGEAPEAINPIDDVARKNYRVEFFFKVNDNVQVRSRAEVSGYRKGLLPQKYGQLLYQDVIFNPLSSRFSGNVRFALFDTPDANTRIYTFENDVLYGYSMHGYQLQGFRFYVNGRFKIKRGVDLWGRYSRIKYPHESEIGSGLEKIDGNTRSEVKVQLRFQF